MCGILLIRSKKKLKRSKCLKALNLLKSRGPDKNYYNFYDSNKLFIGNTLLSVTGKHKKNKELYKSGSKSISFNGEIYNYKEILKNKINSKKESDTHFLVKLIKKIGIEKTLNTIDGMFAFVTFDKIKKTLDIATDAQGEKRLFIFEDNEYLIVSTTILPIFHFIKKININFDVLNSYFYTRHLLFYKNSFYKNLRLLEPGTLIKINLKKEKRIKKFHTNPLSLISKKKYLLFKKMKYNELIYYFDNLFKNQIKQMIPERKFGCIVTGGIDSGLVLSYINDIIKPNYCAVINHYKKDPVIKQIGLFQKKFKQKIHQIKLDSKKYFKNLSKVYRYLNLPLLTHDYPGRYLISKFFNKKKCKVMFTGDGADELFGGYELYLKTNWKTSLNCSPYSKFDFTKSFKNIESFKIQNQLWQKAYIKYSSFMNKREASIQASLFTDYYIQGVSVSNIGTDLISGMNSVEPRCLFLRKSVIQSAINLPLKYKINFKEKYTIFKTKPLLKSLFVKRYNKSMVLKKQGFSGFPGESKKYLNNNQQKKFRAFSKNFNKSKNPKLLWKILNLFYFNLYCKRFSIKNFKFNIINILKF